MALIYFNEKPGRNMNKTHRGDLQPGKVVIFCMGRWLGSSVLVKSANNKPHGILTNNNLAVN
jgi:hypothetical protein